LKMQRAELQIDDQHASGRLRAHDVSRELERIDRGIASHESDDRALDRRRQPAALDHVEIDAGSRKPSATGDQQMGDTAAIGAELEPFDGRCRKPWCLRLEQAHARLYFNRRIPRRDERLETNTHLDFYNRQRPHSSLDRRTPDEAYFDRTPCMAAA